MRPPAGRVAAWLVAGGVRLDPWMPGRQVAWLRRADGGWLALVLVPAASTNRDRARDVAAVGRAGRDHHGTAAVTAVEPLTRCFLVPSGSREAFVG